jgi:uncharacterized protein YndB with AHSA1/START domain
MTGRALIHDTINIEKTINASTQQVFTAWTDPAARSAWGPPSDDEAIEFLESDFRVGGRDVSLCGQKGDLRFRVETVYHDIQQPLRLLFTERVSTADNLLCVSLITAEFVEAGDATKLELTVQVASLVGETMIKGNRGGWEAALNNLGGYLVGRR